MSYEDIINLDHYEPKNHTRMSIYNRSAQFAPFAALTGYGEAVVETTRKTEKRVNLSDEELKELNDNLNNLQKIIRTKPFVEILYFIPDKYKSGGKYERIDTYLKRIDTVNKVIKLIDNKEIKMEYLISIREK